MDSPPAWGNLKSQRDPKVPSTATPCSESAREPIGEGQWPPTWHLLRELGAIPGQGGSARHAGP